MYEILLFILKTSIFLTERHTYISKSCQYKLKIINKFLPKKKCFYDFYNIYNNPVSKLK